MCPDTESTVYTDAFFEQQRLVVNALDNLEARRYMDRSVQTFIIRVLILSSLLTWKAPPPQLTPQLP